LQKLTGIIVFAERRSSALPGGKALDGESQKTASVEIIDRAEPNLRPVKPHPLMKILVPAAGLLAGVLGVVLLMFAAMMKDGARKPLPPLPAS
jgi:uncharacterized protein involved in exopolysaccharide biosynthesis